MRLILPYAIAYLLFSLVCAQIPLFNYLGYEFSALAALVSSVIAGLVTLAIMRDLSRQDALRSGRDLSAAFKPALLTNLTLLVIPLTVMAANAVFVENCSFLLGLGFFLFLPLVSVWFSTCLAFFCHIHYRHPRLIFFTCMVLSFLYAAATGYFTPAIYSYNFFYGFFPGFTYDELLELSWTLVIFRFLTAIIGGILLWCALLLLRNIVRGETSVAKGRMLLRVLLDRDRWRVTLLVVASVGTIWWFRGPLGLESTSGFIHQELGSRLETEHFHIYYSESSFSREEIQWVGAEHEFRFSQILKAFNLPGRKDKLESYIYSSAGVKRRFIGAGTTSIAKPWSGQIHLGADSFSDVLKHELVHALAAPFGVPVLCASLYPGLTEGLAMAIEDDWGNRTLHEYAAVMRRSGLETDMQCLMGAAGFFTQSSSIGYVLTGSFCRFLIDTRGIRLMTQVYKSGDYDHVYGEPLGKLVDHWHAMLDTVRVDVDEGNDAMDVYFRRPTIFRKTCARANAARNAEARGKLAQKEYDDAAELFLGSYRDGGGEDALSGYLTSQLRAGNTSALTSALDTIIMRQEIPGRFLPLFLLIGDAFWKDGEMERARELYGRLARANVSESLAEAATVRLMSLQDSSGCLLRYFLSDAPDSIRAVHLDSVLNRNHLPVASYLKGKLNLRQKRYDAAADMLGTVTFVSTNGYLEAIRLKYLGKALFRMKRFQAARLSFWSSLNTLATRAALNEVNEWEDRCEWFEENGRSFDLE